MRQVSGQGSDLDRTERTLREEENAAGERGGDDDSMLLGLILLQRDLPASLVTRSGDANVTAGWDFRQPGHGAALVMMVMMAVLRGGSRDGIVRSGTRAADSPTGRTIRMMMTIWLMSFKYHAIGGGPMRTKSSGLGIRVMMTMGLMMIASAGLSCLGARHADALQTVPTPETGASATGRTLGG